MDAPLVIKDLAVTYKGKKKKEALKGISLEIKRGEIFGFLGPNGAGKTTTIKSVLNLARPNRGEITLFGLPPIVPRSRFKVGYMTEIATYYWYLTPRELLRMYARFFSVGRDVFAERVEYLLSLAGLQEVSDNLMRTFSKGMMQKVNLIQALINDPELLILDEPTGGLDPLSRVTMRDLIRDLKEKGKTVFFSSHELSEVEMICDRTAILREGEILRMGSLNDLLRERGEQQSLEQYFLGIIRGE